MDELTKLLDSISALLGAVILPLTILFVFRMFRIEINAFIHRANRVAVQGAGVNIAIDAQQAEAAGAIAAAAAKAPVEDRDVHEAAREATAAASVVTETVTPAVVARATSSTILWVDDNPDNNVYERRSLEALGVKFVLAKSTDEGLAKARAQAFDVVITDMGRGVDRTAGYRLIEKLRADGIQTPVLIYAASTNAERRAEARKKGAVDATNRPDELFKDVVSILRGPG